MRRALSFGGPKEVKVVPSHKSDLYQNITTSMHISNSAFLGIGIVTRIGQSTPEAAAGEEVCSNYGLLGIPSGLNDQPNQLVDVVMTPVGISGMDC
jgi:hypothetical protein